MKKLSSIILMVAFFAILILPSFTIPINSNRASPEKEIVYEDRFVTIPEIKYVTPPVVDLPEIEITGKSPRLNYVKVPEYIVDTITIFLPAPHLDKIQANVLLLDDVKTNLGFISNAQEPIYTAMWP